MPLLAGGAIQGGHQCSLAGQGLNSGKLICGRDNAWFPRDRIHTDHRGAFDRRVGTRLGTPNYQQGKCTKAETVKPFVWAHTLSFGELLEIAFGDDYSSVEPVLTGGRTVRPAASGRQGFRH